MKTKRKRPCGACQALRARVQCATCKPSFIIRVRNAGTRRWARVVIPGGKTVGASYATPLALNFDDKYSAEEAAKDFRAMYEGRETKVERR